MSSKYQVIGSTIFGGTMAEAVDSIIDHTNGGYACFVNAHVTVTAKSNPDLRKALDEATFAFPDGMPVYLTGKLKGVSNIEKISGPDFFNHIFASPNSKDLNHFFYGATEEVLTSLVKNLKIKFPDINIVGYESPPFRALTTVEVTEAQNRIKNSKAHLVWVGLGAPKQELWMNNNWIALKPAMLLGVGAAFDFHAGHIQRAPEWASRLGLEWLHRLLQEPSRLWKRYLITNSLFVYYSIVGLILKK